MGFDLDRMIRFYEERTESSREQYGDDYFTQLNQARLNYILELREKLKLTPEEQSFLIARQAVTEVFGRK